MTTIANLPKSEPSAIERIKHDVHTLLRRGMRLVIPATPEAEESRKAAIKRLDEQAWEYNEWRGVEKQAKAEADALKPAIENGVAKLGQVPDGAPKSLRVDTPSFICTTTTGTSMEIDDETVLEFDMQMNTKPLREIFDQLFVRHVEYKLAPTAHQLMKHGKLPKAYEAMIRAYYSNAFIADDKSPSLKVESKDELKAKRVKAAAAAEEKAATRKTGKARA